MSACLGFVVYVDPVLDRLAGWNLVKRPVMLSCLPGPDLTGRAVTLDDLTSLGIVKMPQAHDALAGRNVVIRPLMPYAWADLNLVMTLYGLAIRVRSQIGLNIIIGAMMFNGLSSSNR